MAKVRIGIPRDSIDHNVTQTTDGIWISAKCSCGEGSHASTAKGQITRWINKHLAR